MFQVQSSLKSQWRRSLCGWRCCWGAGRIFGMAWKSPEFLELKPRVSSGHSKSLLEWEERILRMKIKPWKTALKGWVDIANIFTHVPLFLVSALLAWFLFQSSPKGGCSSATAVVDLGPASFQLFSLSSVSYPFSSLSPVIEFLAAFSIIFFLFILFLCTFLFFYTSSLALYFSSSTFAPLVSFTFFFLLSSHIPLIKFPLDALHLTLCRYVIYVDALILTSLASFFFLSLFLC